MYKVITEVQGNYRTVIGTMITYIYIISLNNNY